MFVMLHSKGGKESYINFDKVFSIVPQSWGSTIYMENMDKMVTAYDVSEQADEIVSIVNGDVKK